MPSVPRLNILIQDDWRRCVVFIGTPAADSSGGIFCLGTAFLLTHEGARYLVTVQHIAAWLGDNPFLIRLNRSDGTADNVSIDPLAENTRWHTKADDPDLDLAVMPFDCNLKAAGYDCLFLTTDFVGERAGKVCAKNIGLGDSCCTVGLFQLVAGEKRNLPVVHRGSVALIAGEQRIPVEDWLARGQGKVRYVDCHLVETQCLKGLGRSPVFAHGSFDLMDLPVIGTDNKMGVGVSCKDVSLFGIWQGSWDAPLGSVLGVEDVSGARVPVGMGVVVPAVKLIELLEVDEMKEQRAEIARNREAAKPCYA